MTLPVESGTLKTARIHPWIYVIIPIAKQSRSGTIAGDSLAVFSAFCKACRNYFTEVIPIAFNGKGQMTPSTLPRYGCEPLSDDFDIDNWDPRKPGSG